MTEEVLVRDHQQFPFFVNSPAVRVVVSVRIGHIYERREREGEVDRERAGGGGERGGGGGGGGG